MRQDTSYNSLQSAQFRQSQHYGKAKTYRNWGACQEFQAPDFLIDLTPSFRNGSDGKPGPWQRTTVLAKSAGGAVMVRGSPDSLCPDLQARFQLFRGLLLTGLIMVILAAIANFWSCMCPLPPTAAPVVLIIICGYDLFDARRLVCGAETRSLLVTVVLYPDVLTVFVAFPQRRTALQGVQTPPAGG